MNENTTLTMKADTPEIMRITPEEIVRTLKVAQALYREDVGVIRSNIPMDKYLVEAFRAYKEILKGAKALDQLDS